MIPPTGSRVAVVIPNYNRCDLLRSCLQAVVSQTFRDLAVVVVDNGSTDGSVEVVQREFPQVALIRNPTNRGFAVAMNQGIAGSRSEYVASLNNDTIAEPDWLEQLVVALDDNPDAGMAASTLLFSSPQGMINSAGICVDRLGIAWDRWGGRCERQAHGISSVFGASAGAALYRRRMLDHIGLFDEDYFCYHEDVDLAWRAQLAGWRAVYVPDAVVVHLHSATSRDGSPFKNRLLARNKIWTIIKNYPMPYLMYYLPLVLLYDWLAVIYGTVQMRDPNVMLGRLEGFGRLAQMWSKRRTVQQQRRVPASLVLSRMEPVEAPPAVLQRYAHIRKVRV